MLKSIIFALLLGFSALTLAASENKSPVDKQQQIELFFFWSHYCPHCLEARPFVEGLAQRYAWLNLHSHDLVNNQANVNLYVTMAKQLGMTPNAVPAFIFCGQMQVGFDSAATTGKELENKLLACHQAQQPKPQAEESFDIPLLGKVHYQDFSLPVFTLIIAALDAFNPCAFFVLFFLLSLIVHSRSRWRIAVIGATFVIFSGLMYFAFMAAWLNLFLFTQELSMITALAGLIGIVIGIINIKDYFFFQQGVSLSIADSAKPKLFQRMRNITQSENLPTMLTATVVLAIVANSYELLCTAGLPMVYTRVLTLNHLSSEQYYLYLALYNLIYVLPLLLIVVIFTFTLGSKKLSEREGRLLKLLSGSMMLGLGGILLIAPNLLTNMLVSILVIVVSILITIVFAI
jgi:thiol-disulfide isomerase/thioredoxin